MISPSVKTVRDLFGSLEHAISVRAAGSSALDAALLDLLGANRVCAIGNGPASLTADGTTVPQYPSAFEDYANYLAEQVIPCSTNVHSPLCLGHMSGPLPDFSLELSRVVATLNQNLVKEDASQALTYLERQTIAMLHRAYFQFPDEFYRTHAQCSRSTLGIMTSGGTTANLACLWIARNQALGGPRAPEYVETAGIEASLRRNGWRSAVIIGSRLMHYSIDKAAALLGIGSKNVLRLPVDQSQRLSTASLRSALAECRERNDCVIAVVGIAGTTECGSIDPLDEIADITAAAGVHFHVDAAWGGPLVFAERHSWRLAGINRASSIVLDAHKQLYVPIGASLALVRSPDWAAAIEKQTDYMLQPASDDLGKRAVEGSRPGTSLLVHAALHLIGARGYDQLMSENIRKSEYMADVIRHRPEFELLAEPQTNVLLYRYLLPATRTDLSTRRSNRESLNRFNERLQMMQARLGRTYVSRTTLYPNGNGQSGAVTALRAIIANPHTTEQHIHAVLDDQLSVAAVLDDTVHRTLK